MGKQEPTDKVHALQRSWPKISKHQKTCVNTGAKTGHGTGVKVGH